MPMESSERGRTRNAWLVVAAVVFVAAVVVAYAIHAPLLILAASGLIPLLRTQSASWRPEVTGGTVIGGARVALGERQKSGQR